VWFYSGVSENKRGTVVRFEGLVFGILGSSEETELGLRLIGEVLFENLFPMLRFSQEYFLKTVLAL